VISSDHKFNASKEQIDIKLNEMAATYGEEAQQLLDYYKADPSRLAAIELMVVEQMVQDLILASAKVTIKKKTFEEITQQQS
jgi:trigger factor